MSNKNGNIFAITWILLRMGYYKAVRLLQYHRKNRVLKNAIKMADRSHKITGKQYYVLPNDAGKYNVWCNLDRKEFNYHAKVNSYMPISFVEMTKMAVYQTEGGTMKKR